MTRDRDSESMLFVDTVPPAYNSGVQVLPHCNETEKVIKKRRQVRQLWLFPMMESESQRQRISTSARVADMTGMTD